MKKYSLLLFLLVGIGLTTLVLTLNHNSNAAPTDEIVNDYLEATDQQDDWWSTAEKYGEPGTMNTWAMSSGSMLFQAPHEFEVTQSDAGGVSSVGIYPKAGDGERLIINLFMAEKWEGGEWTLAELQDIEFDSYGGRDEAAECDKIEVDGIDFTCHEVTDENFGLTELILSARISEDHFVLIKRTPEASSTSELLDTVRFNPTDAELADTNLIP